MGSSDELTALREAEAKYNDAKSHARVKKIINDADAIYLADALADGLMDHHVELRTKMYTQSRAEMKDARALEEKAWATYEAAGEAHKQTKK